MLFRFVKYLMFRHHGKTEEWQQSYQKLCDTTDYLYLRKRELKAFRPTLISFFAYCACLWWIAFHPWFSNMAAFVFATIFTLIFLCYFLSIYTYIPIEIEETKIFSRTSATRKPSSVVWKKPKLDEMSLTHKYFIYTTESRKQGVDMTDRILGLDQEYEEESPVFCFTGINNEYYYILPPLEIYDKE